MPFRKSKLLLLHCWGLQLLVLPIIKSYLLQMLQNYSKNIKISNSTEKKIIPLRYIYIFSTLVEIMHIYRELSISWKIFIGMLPSCVMSILFILLKCLLCSLVSSLSFSYPISFVCTYFYWVVNLYHFPAILFIIMESYVRYSQLIGSICP